MIQIKPGTKLKDLAPQIVLAITVAEHIWWNAGQTTLVLTSVNDSKHKEGSFHYRGLAVDLRIKTMPQKLRAVAVRQLKEALGSQFDVLHEGIGADWEHVHIEHEDR